MSSNSLQYLLLQEFVIETKPELHDFMLMDLSAGTLFQDAVVDSLWQCLFRSSIVSTCWLASAQTISVAFYPATQYSSMDDFKSRNHSTWMPQLVVLMSISFWNFTLEAIRIDARDQSFKPFIIESAGVEVWSKMIQSLSNHIKKMKGS